MSSGREFLEAADRALDETYEPPMSIAEYVDAVFDRPTMAAHSSMYLLAAIEAAGTRSVIEEGEAKTRYRFFDDPFNDGEHAVLGNTEVLNAFVDDLRSIAAGRGKEEKIIWFEGPTATGKSELKRCLINGLREYSKTAAGRRYTIEWNIESVDASDRGLSYGIDPTSLDDQHWYRSPVQTHPLSVFPGPVRRSLIEALNQRSDGHLPIRLDADLDPFSSEAYRYLEDRYRRNGTADVFTAVTDEDHLRVRNYVVDVGRGIGVLHAEDDGSPKERLVGSWMHGMLQELDSRGRKNPQAFSYDGVLCQGNGGLTIVEDASQHADLLRKLLNVPDEARVKLDKGIGLDIDTQLLILSNPDLDVQLNQHADREGLDPLKALKRRLDKHRVRYLTNRSLEVELIRRELTNETSIREFDSVDDISEAVRSPLVQRVKRDGDGPVRSVEFAPHAIDAAAMFAVVTRLDDDDLPAELNLIEKAILFDQGYIQEGDTRREKSEFDFGDSSYDGVHGIPVTYTRDVLAELIQTERDRAHGDLPVEDVVMPRDVLNAMVDGLADEPVFSTGERSEFEGRVVPVNEYVFERQESEVLSAIMQGRDVDESTVEEYVEHVYAWEIGEELTNDRGEPVEPDPLRMKVFEIEHLGQFDEDDYDGNAPTDDVRSFRRERVIASLNRFAWEHRDEDFSATDVDLTAIPLIRAILDTYSWQDVRRVYDDLEPRHWEAPPDGTETAAIKNRTIETLVDEYAYSPASAELTSTHVMNEVSHRWD